jgi:hypothetical protein
MRHLLAYLVFVGLPLGGLYAVLRVGQGIEAPMAIHGSYAVEPMAPSGFACYAYLLGGDDSTVTVAQSGRQVIVTLGPRGEVTLAGTLVGAHLTAEGAIPPGTTPRHVACPAGDTIRMTLEARRERRVKRLDASLLVAGCPECQPIGFVAVRSRRYEGRRRS